MPPVTFRALRNARARVKRSSGCRSSLKTGQEGQRLALVRSTHLGRRPETDADSGTLRLAEQSAAVIS